MTEAEVRDRVVQMVSANGGCRAMAKHLKVSPSYVSDVCNGRRAPGLPFLKMLGLKRVIRYEKES